MWEESSGLMVRLLVVSNGVGYDAGINVMSARHRVHGVYHAWMEASGSTSLVVVPESRKLLDGMHVRDLT